MVLTIIFLSEMIIKIIGLGLFGYLQVFFREGEGGSMEERERKCICVLPSPIPPQPRLSAPAAPSHQLAPYHFQATHMGFGVKLVEVRTLMKVRMMC